MLRQLVLTIGAVWIGLWAQLAAAGEMGGEVTEAVGDGAMSGAEVGGIDLTIILVYLVGIVTLGCWAGMRRKSAAGSDYFLAGKSLKWPMIGLALFATNISTIHLVSFAQNGYTSGLVYGNFEWMAAFSLVMLAWFFAPFYVRSGVATLPDFMEKRYSRGNRDYLAVLSIFSAIALHIGFSLYTGMIVLEGSVLAPMGVENPEQYRLYTLIAVCGATGLYTIVGGLMAVVLTESIQTIVLLFGAFCITILGLFMMGGWDGSWLGLLDVGQLGSGFNGVRDSVHPGNFSMVRPDSDPTGISWYAVALGYPVLGIWYWCTDQTIVQRVLGAKDENHARIGPLFAGFIKVLPVFIFVMPGIICLALVNSNTIAPLPVAADGSPETEQAYSHMIASVLPIGMRGVVIAALLAALMSTVSGALNSIATLFSYDIYKRFKPTVDDRHLIRAGRIATFVAMGLAIAWTYMLGGQKSIFQMMIDVFPAVAPPTAVVFFWGVFWRRASSKAALITLIGGSIVGLGVTILSINGLNKIGDYEVNSLLSAFILFVLESIGLVVLSLIFPHKHTAESEALVWKTPLAPLRRDESTWRGLGDFRILAFVLLAMMVGLYVWYAGGDTYYSVDGQITLEDGTPVVGAEVILETDDPRFAATLTTGPEGRYAYGTSTVLGGAPAGTAYRIRITPGKVDYVVQLKPLDPENPDGDWVYDKTLATIPSGTAVDESAIAPGTRWELRPAVSVDAKYADAATSELACEVEAVPSFATKRKHYDFTVE